MPLFRKSAAPSQPEPEATTPVAEAPTTKAPPPASASAPNPDPVEAAELSRAAAEDADTAAQAELDAAAADTAWAADARNFPGTSDADALKQLAAQRAASARTFAAVEHKAATVEALALADAALRSAKRKELESAAESYHWGCEWAGRALLAAIVATPPGRPVQGLEAAVALCREAEFDRAQLLEELLSATPKIIPAKAPPLSVAASLSAIIQTRENGLPAVYAIALAASKWVEATTQREGEHREQERRREMERVRQERVEDASGRRGAMAQAKAIAEERAGILAMSQPRLPGASLAHSPAEVAAYALNAKLSGQLS